MKIDKNQVKDVVVSGEFDIEFSLKAMEGTTEKKEGTLRFKLEDVPLADIIASSLKDKRINWQASARKQFESIVEGIITVDYKGGRAPVDKTQAAKSLLGGMSPEELIAWLKANGLIY